MPNTLPVFQSSFAKFLSDQGAGTTDDTAGFIADEYHNAVQNVFPGTVPGATPIGLIASDVKDGFVTTFNNIFDKEASTSPGDYMPAADGIVKYWTGKNLKPSGIPPGTVATISNQITFGGASAPLAAQIFAAFGAMNENAVAAGLAAAFQTHLFTISGIWNGTMPGPSGVIPSPPIPWVGLI